MVVIEKYEAPFFLAFDFADTGHLMESGFC